MAYVISYDSGGKDTLYSCNLSQPATKGQLKCFGFIWVPVLNTHSMGYGSVAPGN